MELMKINQSAANSAAARRLDRAVRMAALP